MCPSALKGKPVLLCTGAPKARVLRQPPMQLAVLGNLLQLPRRLRVAYALTLAGTLSRSLAASSSGSSLM